MVRVTDARYVRDYVVWLRFADGTEGEVDLQDELHGEVFRPLRDKKLFRAVSVHPEWHTIAWPNGADLAPEFLYAAVTARLTRRSSRPRRRSRSGRSRAGAGRGG
jgi:hypothetical protein